MNDDVIVIHEDDEVMAGASDYIDGDPEAEAPAPLDQPVGLPPAARVQHDGSVILPLAYPVTLKWRRGEVTTEETFAEIHLHRLTGAHMQRIGAAAAGSNGAVVTLACSTRLPHGRVQALFDRMDAVDVNASSQVLGFLLGGGPRAGR